MENSWSIATNISNLISDSTGIGVLFMNCFDLNLIWKCQNAFLSSFSLSEQLIFFEYVNLQWLPDIFNSKEREKNMKNLKMETI